LSDARRIASVLPDRDFVQMAGVVQNKFKSSVASGLHLLRPKVPNWNNRAPPGRCCACVGDPLPLTADDAAGFNPAGTGDARDG
jgi:hypothetical protein